MPCHPKHDLGPAAWASPGSLWEMQHLRPCPRSPEPVSPLSCVSRWLMGTLGAEGLGLCRQAAAWALVLLLLHLWPWASDLTSPSLHFFIWTKEKTIKLTHWVFWGLPKIMHMEVVNTELRTGKCPINASNGIIIKNSVFKKKAEWWSSWLLFR